MKFFLRIITVICYFLPFTFFMAACDSPLSLNFSYNQTEADKVLYKKESIESYPDTIAYGQPIIMDADLKNISEDTTKQSTEISQKSSEIKDRIIRQILTPTETSLSGIGSVLFSKNLTAKIAIALSLLTSLVLLITFRFLKSIKIKLYLLSASALCLIIFIMDALISKVTLLWGAWILFVLILFQLMLELSERKKTRHQSLTSIT